jgi:phosphomannomutase
MTDSGWSVAALDESLPKYEMVKRVFPAETLNGERISSALQSRFGAGREDRSDGVRLEWERRWIQVRSSNTEPVVRVLAEAPTREEAEDLFEAAARALAS